MNRLYKVTYNAKIGKEWACSQYGETSFDTMHVITDGDARAACKIVDEAAPRRFDGIVGIAILHVELICTNVAIDGDLLAKRR